MDHLRTHRHKLIADDICRVSRKTEAGQACRRRLARARGHAPSSTKRRDDLRGELPHLPADPHHSLSRFNVGAQIVGRPPQQTPNQNLWLELSRVSDPSDRGQGLGGFDEVRRDLGGPRAWVEGLRFCANAGVWGLPKARSQARITPR